MAAVVALAAKDSIRICPTIQTMSSKPIWKISCFIPNSKLDQRISEWQEAINEYKLYEDNYLELADPKDNLEHIIKNLRKNPENYTSDKFTVHVRKLADKKMTVNKLENNLGITKELMAQMSSKTENDDFTEESESDLAPKNPQYISVKLSVMWANRLNEINPTQGALQMEEAHSDKKPHRSSKHLSSTDMKIRPKWPDFLIDTSYDVVKVNRFGHKMRRTLKLTQNHVIGT